MPTYAYRCANCKTLRTVSCTLEQYDPALKCELCKQPQTRIYDAPAVTFNSPGFYSTDKGNR